MAITDNKSLKIATLIRNNEGSLDIITDTSISTGKHIDKDCIRVRKYLGGKSSGDVKSERIQVWIQQHYPIAKADITPPDIRIQELAESIADLIECNFSGAVNVIPSFVMDVDGKQVYTINLEL